MFFFVRSAEKRDATVQSEVMLCIAADAGIRWIAAAAPVHIAVREMDVNVQLATIEPQVDRRGR